MLLKTKLLYISPLISEAVMLKTVLGGTLEPERRIKSCAI